MVATGPSIFGSADVLAWARKCLTFWSTHLLCTSVPPMLQAKVDELTAALQAAGAR